MRIEIDQSWKIENTNKHSVLAFSDGISSSVLIPAEDKRILQKFFREAGKPEMFVYRTFAVLAYHLVKDYLDEIDTIVFDREYPSKEALIKDLFLQLARRDEPRFDKNSVWFDEIRKKSNAHWEAYWVFKGEKEPTKITPTKWSLEKFFRKTKDRAFSGCLNRRLSARIGSPPRPFDYIQAQNLPLVKSCNT